MKPVLFVLMFLIFLLKVGYINAQSGWQWGITNTNQESRAIVYQSIADKWGNGAWASGIMYGDSLVFGSQISYNTDHMLQIFIARADSSGNFLWSFSTQHSYSWPVGLIADSSGNLFFLGEYSSDSCSVGPYMLRNPWAEAVYFMAKISPSGSVLWARTITPGLFSGTGPLQTNTGGIGLDATGNIYVAGGFSLPLAVIGPDTLVNTTTIGHNTDLFVAKYDTAGNAIWARKFGGADSDWPDNMVVSPRGNLYVFGNIASHYMTIGTTPYIDSTTSYSAPQKFLTKIDNSGNVVWANGLNKHSYVYKMILDTEEDIYMACATDTDLVIGSDVVTSLGGSDAFLAKYSSTGTAIWTRTASGTSTDYGYCLSLDHCGYIWFGVGNGATAGPLPGYAISFSGHTITAPTTAIDPLFLAKYDTLGNYQEGMAIASCGDNYGNSINVDTKGNFILCSDYKTGLRIGPDTLLAAGGNSELLIARYNYQSIVCPPDIPLAESKQASAGKEFAIFPNPARIGQELHINDDLPLGSFIEIYSVTGKLMIQSKIGNVVNISLVGFNAGVYYCKIYINGIQTMIEKLIIQA